MEKIGTTLRNACDLHKYPRRQTKIGMIDMDVCLARNESKRERRPRIEQKYAVVLKFMEYTHTMN
jgi:hypothetical protein